jgi:hypothetical protein
MANIIIKYKTSEMIDDSQSQTHPRKQEILINFYEEITTLLSKYYGQPIPTCPPEITGKKSNPAQANNKVFEGLELKIIPNEKIKPADCIVRRASRYIGCIAQIEDEEEIQIYSPKIKITGFKNLNDFVRIQHVKEGITEIIKNNTDSNATIRAYFNKWGSEELLILKKPARRNNSTYIPSIQNL